MTPAPRTRPRLSPQSPSRYALRPSRRQPRHGVRPGDQATSTPTTTDARWGQFRPSRWGQCKSSFRIGLLLVVMVSAASVQDRDGGRGILKRLHRALASVRHIFADGGYQGQLIATAKSAWNIVVEVVKKPVDQLGFAVLPRRWVVERTFSWLLRWRRLVRDYERLPETHEAMIKWAMVGLMLNRLAPPPGPKPWSSKNKRQ